MKQLVKLFVCSILILGLTLAGAMAFTGKTYAAYDGANLIDNQVFLDANSMNIDQIQNFLANKGSGLANRSFQLNCYGPDSKERQWYAAVGAPCDQVTPASHIIYYASKVYGVNPQVVLATMQKEQSLITSPNPTDWQINQAMGYGCPTNGGCGASTFFYQVDYGTWVLRYHYERANRNYTWWNDNPNWVCGNEKKYYKPNLYPGQNVHFYDDNGVHYRTYFIANAATSSLYCYTPHTYNNPQGLYGNPPYGSTGQYYSGSYNFVKFFELWFGSTQTRDPIISYKSHVSDLGWLPLTKYSGQTGTTGKSKPMEAFKVNGLVEYASYNFNTGWQPTVNRGMISGTTGQSRPIQAIKINPIESLANEYDIWYRVHVSDIGWMGWAKNGEIAGVTGDANKKIEAFDIQPMPKGSMPPGTTDDKYRNHGASNPTPPLTVKTTAHVSYVGWQPTVTDDMVSGTTEQGRAIEAIRIDLTNNTGLSGGIVYSSHLADIGWQENKTNNAVSGTTGQARRMEAIRIALTDDLARNYDIWYRAHVQSVGWLGWAKNGTPAGSVGMAKQLEAVEIRVAPKGSLRLSGNALLNPKNQYVPESYALRYSAHVRDKGWLSAVNAGGTAGTTGQSRPLEAIRINQLISMQGLLDIECSAYVKGSDWTGPVNSGACGTTGQAKPIEAIKLTLSGTIADLYDIEYRVHLSQLGWQNWTKNGEVAGLPNSGKNIEAVAIRLIQK